MSTYPSIHPVGQKLGLKDVGGKVKDGRLPGHLAKLEQENSTQKHRDILVGPDLGGM